MAGWSFWIDRGGTFTDLVARRPDGSLTSHKLLSSDPDRYSDAPIEGIRRLLSETGDDLDGAQIVTVRMGTTVATNALLERRGEPTALLITRGFADALRVGNQERPSIFARHIVLPDMLYCRVVEVDERITAQGQVRRPLDETALRRSLQVLIDEGIRSVAIVFLHGYRWTRHEQKAAAIARQMGMPQVSTSSEVSPLQKLIPRGDTTVVDAYLSPVLRRYVKQVADALPGVSLYFMQSNGGLAQAAGFRGKNAVLSGPAGGIVGMAQTSLAIGFDRVVGFDMGGTSTDVSHFAGEYERTFDSRVAGVRLRAPMLDIHTVAAGGGSILSFDGSRFRVGPESAGADPGPACYRRGGPLTITDANVMLGRVRPDHFPAVFGPGADQQLDAAVVERMFTDLAQHVSDTTGQVRSAHDVALGFIDVAVATMADAIKRISVRKGHDLLDHALTSFGGAGGQHACAVAEALGVTTVIVPPRAGVLSAVGMGLADVKGMRERTVGQPLEELTPDHLAAIAEELAVETLDEMAPAEDTAQTIRRVYVRYQGTDTWTAVLLAGHAEMTAQFREVHRRIFGFDLDRPVVAEAVSVEVTVPTEQFAVQEHPDGTTRDSGSGPDSGSGLDRGSGPDRGSVRDRAVTTGEVWFPDGPHEVPIWRRTDIGIESTVAGPALVVEPDGTTVIPAGWSLQRVPAGHLLISRDQRRLPDATSTGIDTEQAPDPVLLEIFNNLFMSIADQMGSRLAATAQSVNIKERLDFSCALFDATGALIANAPHMPVHLGSMGRTVREVIERNAGLMVPGDVYAINDPYHGGTHLPDITVVSPVFPQQLGLPADTTPSFFVASRGHHAELGGITPGSMPAFSTTLTDEGVLFDNFLLVRDGRLREEELYALLRRGPYPSRDPDTNIADLRAQAAANAKGIDELARMVAHFGADVVDAYMSHVQDNAADAIRRVLDEVSDGTYRYEMDSGAVIQVCITVDRVRRRAVIDFSGSTQQLHTNFNAPTSVVTAAVLYVMRTLVEDDIPLNDGCLRPIDIVVPTPSMLAPEPPAAVVAGNVETSQAITGALYGALGVQAEGSGTMNNLVFGNEDVQYYETIGSGSGAGDGFPGTDAVQTHMTNSRLTDPEVLEARLPVWVEDFTIRRGSGGVGRWPGGDGLVRRLRFREPVTVSVLSGHRRIPPYGMDGGSPGALGRNIVEYVGGATVELPGCDSVALGVGDAIVVETPGGGGFGEPD